VAPLNPSESSRPEGEPSRQPGRANPEPNESAHLPSPEEAVLRTFAEFCEAHSRKLFSTDELAKAWVDAAPKLRFALWDSPEPSTDAPMNLRVLAGAYLPGGNWQLLISIQDSRTGDYLLPTPARINRSEASADERGGHWARYPALGAALMVSLSAREKVGQPIHIGFSYALSPAALELDEAKLVSGEDISIIGATIVQTIPSRTGKAPSIETIARWRPRGSDSTFYQLAESDGTRHFIEVSSANRSIPDGIVHLESVPAVPRPIAGRAGSYAPRQVGTNFEDFHLEFGFKRAEPADFTARNNLIERDIESALRGHLPNVDPAWRFEINRVVEKRDGAVILVGFHDAEMNSFIPGERPEATICDPVFSGILVSVHDEVRHAPRPGASGKLLDFIGKAIPAVGRRSEKVLHLDVVGPVLSDETWAQQLTKLHLAPSSSILYPAVLRAVSAHLGESPPGAALEITRVTPLRLVTSRSPWENLVVSVDHSRGTHIVEIPRQPKMGLVALGRTVVQQYFPTTRGELRS